MHGLIRIVILVSLSVNLLSLPSYATRVVWPTPSTAFLEGKRVETWAQPTASGLTKSALFGCVRSSGYKFHEGIDITPIARDKRSEATDKIFAAMDGRVSYILTRNGFSSYGRYVVIEHDNVQPAVYTLYAHLASVEPGLTEGQRVEAGQPIGTMGRSATGYSIPKDRAHLHFEVGLRLSDNFDAWYNKQREFGSKNHHGDFSGFNLTGMNPLALYEQVRDGKFRNMRDYINALPTAFVIRVATSKTPDFVRRYPSLLTNSMPNEPLMGWDVEFSAYGLPKRWRPLTDTSDPLLRPRGNVSLLYFDEELLKEAHCRDMIDISGSTPSLDKQLRRTIEILFEFY